MSGSFYKNDSCEMMNIMALTGPVVDTVKAKELIDKGFISKVKIKSVLIKHNDFDFTENLKIVASRDKKSAYDLETAKIQESNERLEIINKIVSQCKQNTLVLFHNTEYGQKILKYLKENNKDKEFFYIDGSVKNNGNSKNIINNRNYIKKEMEKTDKVKVLVASFGTLSVGVSIKAICNIIFCQSFKKEQVIIQAIGRALRLHIEKTMAYIFDIVDIFNEEIEPKFKSKKFHNILYNH
jgi:superfamily II DNA or RNA helicase